METFSKFHMLALHRCIHTCIQLTVSYMYMYACICKAITQKNKSKYVYLALQYSHHMVIIIILMHNIICNIITYLCISSLNQIKYVVYSYLRHVLISGGQWCSVSVIYDPVLQSVSLQLAINQPKLKEETHVQYSHI